MRILHSADWHIGNFSGPEQDGVNLRALDTDKCIEFLINKAKEENPDIVVISGDIFHTAKVWADRGLSETKKAIQYLKELAGISIVVLLRGTPNHDGEEQFQMLKNVLADHENIHIMDTPTNLLLETNDGMVNVCGLPGFSRGDFRAKYPGLSKEEENQVFTDELGKIILGLKVNCTNNLSILLSHYSVPGCNMESGQTQMFSQAEPLILPEILTATQFDLTALGHIHRPQQLDFCKNTFYSGAVNAMNFNDEGQDRGFWMHEFILNEDSGSHPSYSLSSTYHSTPYRQFLTIILDDTCITELNNGNTEHIATSKWAEAVKNKIVRVLYSCTEDHNKAFNKALLERRLYEDGAFWVSEITPERIVIGTNKESLADDNTPEANLRDYLVEKGYNEIDTKLPAH